MNDLNNLLNKLDYTKSKEIKYMKQKSFELVGEGNRLFRDKVPGVILTLERDNQHLKEDIEELEEKIDKANKTLTHRMGKIQKLSDMLSVVSLDQSSKNLTDLGNEINHYRNLGHNLKKKFDEIVEQSKACANLVVPIQKTHNRANILSYHEVYARFQENTEERLNKVMDYKFEFNRRIEELLGMYQQSPDLAILVPFFKRTIATNHSIKTRLQTIIDEMKWIEDRVHQTTDIMFDLMSPVVPEGKFSLRTLIDDWTDFTQNNSTVQDQVDDLVDKAAKKRDEVLWRILNCESKIEWITSRLRVWEGEIRGQVFYEESFDDSMAELEKNMDKLEALVNEKWGKSEEKNKLFEELKMMKDSVLKPTKMDIKDIGTPPEYEEVDLEKIKIPFPKLDLTYPDTAMSVNAQVLQVIGPRRRSVMPKNVRGLNPGLKISFYENDDKFRKKLNEAILTYGKEFENTELLSKHIKEIEGKS
ncbi:hypothetical protein TVAG_167180 [Trichomonas vaginalis G3]|uniref:Uncharacterized protein n=1 Tax=Trichomonas vaginalis (strain ATCC PRA-98 / G3) TaxID=412133 RepID=A2DEC5_TRIV3|nr:hypothetical protein TVAGG3_0175460 [Trichomonas vaginalis G3]EAY21343.1 hypothetical protein TVAG_167180 [Trichomonas vaginalis G3]KAI5548919.1 hypothetical protein TVAGG3_0175460 [Trichomonas vaginalis G3]|eukprot:XP_001582329.1 hypothetical protein [Trichomonas vaginalis G3]